MYYFLIDFFYVKRDQSGLSIECTSNKDVSKDTDTLDILDPPRPNLPPVPAPLRLL